jgi:hypothetical protein
LERDKTIRPSIKQIKDHPFFQGVIWEDVLNMKLTAPYLPVGTIFFYSRYLVDFFFNSKPKNDF